MLEKIKRDPLPENPSLEEVMKNELNYLEAQLGAHAHEADRFRQEAGRIKDMLRSAGITVR